MNATTNPKIETTRAFFEAYAQNDRQAIAGILAEDIEWTIPGHHPLAGAKHGIDEVLAFLEALAECGFQADTFFLEASDEHVVDIHRGYSTSGAGKVDTTWALIWHFNESGKIDRVSNLSGDQHQMDTFIWANYQLKPLPDRLER